MAASIGKLIRHGVELSRIVRVIELGPLAEQSFEQTAAQPVGNGQVELGRDRAKWNT